MRKPPAMTADDARALWIVLAAGLNAMPLTQAARVVEEIRRDLKPWPRRTSED